VSKCVKIADSQHPQLGAFVEIQFHDNPAIADMLNVNQKFIILTKTLFL